MSDKAKKKDKPESGSGESTDAKAAVATAADRDEPEPGKKDDSDGKSAPVTEAEGNGPAKKTAASSTATAGESPSAAVSGGSSSSSRTGGASSAAGGNGASYGSASGGIPSGAGRGGEPPSAAKATPSMRKAHLSVSRVEPWSVMKFSFVVSLVCFIVLFVAVAVIYAILAGLGVFDELTNMITALLEGEEGEELGLNPSQWFSPGVILGYTGVLGALNIVVITALCTVGALLYNLVADLVGGIDITLTEAE